MKTRGSNFIHSKDLAEAAMSIMGRVDGVSLARAMRKPKMRRALREEQLRLAMQKARAPTGGDT
jgi:hypothetical protein